MNKNPDTYNRARIEILNYILNFSIVKYFGDKKEGYEWTFNSIESAFRGSNMSNDNVPIGSLCIISCAPFTKFYLSWLIEYDEKRSDGGSYLMQSVEDHSLCWWTNISVYFFPIEQSNKFPQWKWSDRQFEFYDRWQRAAKRVNDHFTKILHPIFHPDGGVTLGTRQHIWMTLGESEGYRPTKTFLDWRKVKFSEMVEFYKYAVKSTPKTTA